MITKTIVKSAFLSVVMMGSALHAMQGSNTPPLKSDADLKSASKDEIVGTIKFILDQAESIFKMLDSQHSPLPILVRKSVSEEISSMRQQLGTKEQNSVDLQDVRLWGSKALEKIKQVIAGGKTFMNDLPTDASVGADVAVATKLANALLDRYSDDVIGFFASDDNNLAAYEETLKAVKACCSMAKSSFAQLSLAPQQKAAVDQITELAQQLIQTPGDIENLVKQVSALSAVITCETGKTLPIKLIYDSSSKTAQDKAQAGVSASGQPAANESANKQSQTNNTATQNDTSSLKKDEPKLKLEKKDTALEKAGKDKQSDDKDKKPQQSDAGMISNVMSAAKNRWYLVAAPLALIGCYLLYLHVHSYDEYDDQYEAA